MEILLAALYLAGRLIHESYLTHKVDQYARQQVAIRKALDNGAGNN
jgi:hypothetical protein